MPPTPNLRLLPCLLSVAAFAQERPAWQALRSARIDGAATVGAARIRSALAQDTWTRRAIAGGDASAAAGIAARLTDALHGCGLVQARVEVTRLDEDWWLRIAEGPLHRCGPIAIAGATAIPAADLAACLEPAQDGWPGWQPGQPAPADPWLRHAAAARIEQACRERGYHGAAAEAAFHHTDGTTTLTVTMTAAGRQLRASRIDIEGERDDDDEAAALALLAWTPDRVLTAAAIDGLRDRLLRTGRYASVTVQLPDDPPPILDPLVVAVQPIAGAPGFADPRTRDLARIAAGLDSLQARVLAGSHARLTIDLNQPLALGVLQLLPGALVVDLGTQGCLVTAPGLATAGAAPAPAALAIDQQGLWLRCFARCARLEFDGDFGLHLEARTNVTADGVPEFRWGFGIATGGRPQRTVAFAPGTAAAMLQRPTIRREWHDEVLHLTFGETTIRLGPDGRIADDTIAIPTAEPPMTVALRDEPIGAAIASARAAGRDLPQAPLLPLLLELAAGAAGDSVQGPEPVRVALLAGIPAALRERTVEAPSAHLPPLRIRTPDDDRPAGDATMAMFATLFCTLAASSDAEGWPTHLFGCATTFVDGNPRGGLRSLLQYADRPTTGPLALWSFAAACSVLADAELPTRLRTAARARWGLGAVLTDLEPFLQPDGELGKAVRAIGAHWRKTEALRELVGAADDDFAAFRLGLEHLWRLGLGDRLRDLLLPASR